MAKHQLSDTSLRMGIRDMKAYVRRLDSIIELVGDKTPESITDKREELSDKLVELEAIRIERLYRSKHSSNERNNHV